MALGSSIIVSACPRGVHHEGTINGAQQPGICVQIDVSEGLNGSGRPQWEPYNTAISGEQRLIAVLTHDTLQGKVATAAYVDGDQCFVYCPLPGEELNMLVQDISGTADDHSFGDLLMIEDGTGLLISSSGTVESEPFILLEALTDITADTLAHCMYSGY